MSAFAAPRSAAVLSGKKTSPGGNNGFHRDVLTVGCGGLAQGWVGGRGKGWPAMRRILLATVLAGLVIGLMAGPARASTPLHNRSSYASVEAFWHSKVRQSSTRFELVTWYVGVYPSTYGTFSDLYKEVDECRLVSGHQRCTFASYSAGYLNSLSAAQFSYDAKRLESAKIHATYKLRTFTKYGRTEPAFKVTIVAAWTGIGKLTRAGGSSVYHSGCTLFHYTFRDRYRSAAATGSVNGKSLGRTTDASLAASTSLNIEHQCPS
jgi:hypothetical protein